MTIMNRARCEAAIAGDLRAFDEMEKASNDELRVCCGGEALVVDRASLRRAIKSSALDQAAQERLKRWAFLCWEGELWRVGSPEFPVTLYNSDDDVLLGVLRRLWELGEFGEGWLSADERSRLLARLRDDGVSAAG